MKIKCIIIEDEPLAQEKLAGFVGHVPMLQLERVFDNAIEAIGYLNENKTDLIFLDIQMKKFNGIQFMESITNRPHIIIVSAFDHYAIKSYEFSVSDYLLKPYSFERFMQAVNKVLETRITAQQNASQENDDEVLFVKSGNRIEKIELKQILYVQGMKDYQMIVTGKMKTMTLQTFKEIENVLPEPCFVRIHKSYIVAVRKIDSIERNRIKIGDQLLPISDTYKANFYEILKKSKHLM